MKVLVCGGRDYQDWEKVFYELDNIHKSSLWKPISEIIQGEALGADRCVKNWAKDRNVICKSFPADWNKYGRNAGPIRNKQMLDEGNPELVIAFPGGKGTANMVKLSKQCNIQVIEVDSHL